jgi:hypothetical protein
MMQPTAVCVGRYSLVSVSIRIRVDDCDPHDTTTFPPLPKKGMSVLTQSNQIGGDGERYPVRSINYSLSAEHTTIRVPPLRVVRKVGRNPVREPGTRRALGPVLAIHRIVRLSLDVQHGTDNPGRRFVGYRESAKRDPCR